MNTSRVVSSVPCSRIQRRRARGTSATFCLAARRLFFEGDLMTLEEALYRAAAAGNPSLLHRRDHLIQRQVRLVRDQREQTVRVLLQRRRARAAWLRGASPVSRKHFTHLIAVLALISKCSAASRREAPLSTRAMTRPGISAEYALGIVRPPNSNQCDRLAPPRALGKSNDSIGRNLL